MNEEKLTTRQRAARRRVARELEKDPDKYRKLGFKGGKRKVAKGTSKLSKECRVKRSTEAANARHHPRTEVPDPEDP